MISYGLFFKHSSFRNCPFYLVDFRPRAFQIFLFPMKGLVTLKIFLKWTIINLYQPHGQ